MIHEYTDNYDKALDIWANIRSKEGAERTVAILKKLGSRDKILKYAKWVFDVDAPTGFKLFVTFDKKESASDDLIGNTAGINMSKDEVLNFLDEVQQTPDTRRTRYATDVSLKQQYLEWVTKNKNANEKYFTMLGEILIDNCF